MLTAALKLQIQNLNSKGEIVQNMKISLISQNSDLSSNLGSTHQNKFGGILGFQNRASKAQKPKWHAKRCNIAYFE